MENIINDGDRTNVDETSVVSYDLLKSRSKQDLIEGLAEGKELVRRLNEASLDDIDLEFQRTIHDS